VSLSGGKQISRMGRKFGVLKWEKGGDCKPPKVVKDSTSLVPVCTLSF